MHLEYASSGRASCRTCGSKIEKGAVRLGVQAFGDYGPFTKWHHAECYDLRGIDLPSLPGFSRLLVADRMSIVGPPGPRIASWPPPAEIQAAAAANDDDEDADPSSLASSQAASSQGADGLQLTQTRDEEAELAEREIPFAVITALLVGIQHYRGVVHPGEYVTLVREPRNPYDANAVRVDNMHGIQVGHLKREQAAGIAPLMDDRSEAKLRLETIIPHRGSAYNMPCEILVVGLPVFRESFIAYAHGMNLPLRPISPRGEGGSGTEAGGQPDVRVDVKAWDRHKSQAELDQLFESMWDEDEKRGDVISQPEAVRTPLQAHQTRGVAWMIAREKSATGGGSLPPFWETRKEQNRTVFFNVITCCSQTSRPRPVAGGLLADDMGLGKTMHVLSLVACHPRPGISYRPQQQVADSSVPEGEEDGQQAEASVSREEVLGAMNVKELQKECRRLGVAKSGKKTALVERILASEATVKAAASNSGPQESSQGVLAGTDRADGPRGTLVVVPLSVVFNWEQQVAEHLFPGTLKVYIYHGPDRCHDPNFLAQQDLVVTTYQTLTSELSAAPSTGATGGKRKGASGPLGGIYGLQWRRVVLDEAHVIRNRATSTFRACVALESRFHWCLTGTPMQNRAEDVQALLAFLQCSPLDKFDIFNRSVGRLIRMGDPTGAARLKVALKSVCLRRTKQQVLSSLPAKVAEVHSIRLDGEAEEAYHLLYDAGRHVMSAMLRAGGDSALMESYASVLEVILRLRQTCLSLELLPANRVAAARSLLDKVKKEESKTGGKPVSLEDAKRLLQLLKGLEKSSEAQDSPEDAVAECSICLENILGEAARVLRPCRHYFCGPCLDHLLKSSLANRCPLCRCAFGAGDLVSVKELEETMAEAPKEKPEPKDTAPEEMTEVAHNTTSEIPAKVRALTAALQAMKAEDASQKAVIFSSFSSFLDLMASYLNQAGVRIFQLDGKMSAKKRKEMLTGFEQHPGTCVILISLKAGGVGLNLTCANYVFMMDLWWNASVEEQAIDRVHRIGQTRPVKVIRYVCKGTIEERILEIQERKAATSRMLLNKPSPEEGRQARVRDITHIFGVGTPALTAVS